MAILIVATDRDVSPLQHKIQTLLAGEAPVWVYPDIPDPAQVEMAVLWKHPADLLPRLPNLRLISSLGAGVEHILADPHLPAGISITRIVDEALTLSMRNYVVMAVLNIQRNFLFYLENQAKKQWKKPKHVELPLRIGMLGLGALGGEIARFLAEMGFDLSGYSNSPKRVPGVQCFNSKDKGLTNFVKSVDLLICLLPSTPNTYGILNYELFRHLPKGAFLINVARGSHLVEPDLLKAMEEGFIQQAYLDVFQEEPLPANHPFWAQPGILITPHIASVTNQGNAAVIIAGNFRQLKRGSRLRYEVDRAKGY